IEKRAKVVHALRSTFISLALDDGAYDYILDRVTHTTKQGRAFNVYAKPQWETLCREVTKLRFGRPAPTARGGEPGGKVIAISSAYGRATAGFATPLLRSPQAAELIEEKSGGAGSRTSSGPQRRRPLAAILNN